MLDKVTTPDGRMQIAPPLYSWIASTIDIGTLGIVFAFSSIALRAFGFSLSYSSPFIVIPIILGTFFYIFLAHWHAVPSIGNWSLGLRRYRNEMIEEYAGAGILFVVEDLPWKVRTARRLTAIAVVITAYLLYGTI